MRTLKNTQRACVQSAFNGVVRKCYSGKHARNRFENEVRVLRHLERAGCDFVPRLLAADPESLEIHLTDCGSPIEWLDDTKKNELFDELLAFGVRHKDREMRNLLYCTKRGRFTIIDFEFADIFSVAEQELEALERLIAEEI